MSYSLIVFLENGFLLNSNDFLAPIIAFFLLGLFLLDTYGLFITLYVYSYLNNSVSKSLKTRTS